jgi:phage-related protein
VFRQGTASAVPKSRQPKAASAAEGPASNAVRSESRHARKPHHRQLLSSRSAARDLLFTLPKPRSLPKTTSKTPAFRQGTASAVPKTRQPKAASAAEGPASNAVRSKSRHVRKPHHRQALSSRSAARDLLFTPPKPHSLAKTTSKTPAVRQGTASAVPKTRQPKAASAAEGRKKKGADKIRSVLVRVTRARLSSRTPSGVRDLLFTPPKPHSLAKTTSKTPAVRQGTALAVPKSPPT